MIVWAALPVIASAQRLSLAKSTIDVGQTAYETPITATFEVRNKGLRKLRITNVIPDCNCTRVEYPKGEVGVGDKFTIKMTYDSRQLGHFNKQAAIFVNDAKKPTYITMTGVVREDITDYSGTFPYDFNGLLADKNDIEFDNINRGDRPQMVIHVMNNGKKVMETNIQHLPAYLTQQVSPTHLPPHHSGKIVLTLNSEKIHDYGLTQTNVYLAQRLGERVSSEREIGVSAVLLPEISHIADSDMPELALSDSVLNISFAGKSKKTGEIILYNPGKATLEISSLQLFTRGLKVTLGKRTLAPGETTKLKVTAYAADLKKTRSRPRVLMITNAPHHQKVVISINAN